jgi:hypothetical protein
MKTTKLLIAVLVVISNSIAGFGQLIGTNVTAQTPISEVRKGSTVAYSVSVGHIAGEQYSWSIVGGVPTPAPSSGSGTAADPYIVNFTANLTDISVNWGADDNTAASQTGRVRVQKRNAGGCISVIQDLQVDRWSAATARITSPATATICNGENVGYTVAIAFTGAPNFDLDYRIDNNLTGVLQTTNQTITGVTGGTASITIPDNLINTTSADQTYTVTLTRMNDSFTGDGAISATAYTYTITVHPAAAISPITVSPASLIRR